MKKLLLAFSLIAAFGLGITATSITIPPNRSVEVQDGDEKKEKKKKKKKKKSKECCSKSSTNNTSNKPSCCSKGNVNSDKK
jgi:hypothetical protein